MENWKDIKGYEKLYQISNFGRIRSLDHYVQTKNQYGTKSERLVKGQILKASLNKKGYFVQTLTKSKKKQYQIHRLVALTFINNQTDKNIVHHKNKIKTDNRVSNLMWVDSKEHIDLHSIEHSKPPYKGIGIKCSNGMKFNSSYSCAEWINTNIFKGSKKTKSIAANIRYSIKNNVKCYNLYYFKELL